MGNSFYLLLIWNYLFD